MKKTARIRTGKLLFRLDLRAMAALCCVSFFGIAGTQAQTWNGGSTTDSNWSDAANWTGGVAPVSGNTTALTFSGSTRLAPNMDSDFRVKSLTISGTSSFDFLGSNTLTFDAASSQGTFLTDNAAAAQTIESNIVVNDSVGGISYISGAAGSLTLNGNVTATTAVGVTVRAGTTTTFNGVLSGSFIFGSATAPSARIVLGGTTANAMTGTIQMGTTTANAVTVELNKSAGVAALTGTTAYIGVSSTLKLDNDDQITNTMAFQMAGASILMQGHSATVASISFLSGSNLLDFGAGSLTGLTLGSTGTDISFAVGTTLTIDNWNGTDYLRLATHTAPSSSILQDIDFDGYAPGATATLNGGYYYVTPLTVPEPRQTALLGLGGFLALLAWMRTARGRESTVR